MALAGQLVRKNPIDESKSQRETRRSAFLGGDRNVNRNRERDCGKDCRKPGIGSFSSSANFDDSKKHIFLTKILTFKRFMRLDNNYDTAERGGKPQSGDIE